MTTLETLIKDYLEFYAILQLLRFCFRPGCGFLSFVHSGQRMLICGTE